MKTKKCAVCGEGFELNRSWKKYCSKKCQNRVDKNARRFSGCREYILKRDNFKCVECGATKKLTVHHKDADKFNNVSKNLVTLCRSCHASLHNRGYFEIRKEIKKCFICGDEFYPIRKTHILCRSKVCRAEWKKIQKRSEHDTVNCLVCGKMFVQKHSNHLCCSVKCRRKNEYEENKDKHLDRQKLYYINNKEKVKAYVKKWQKENLYHKPKQLTS